ncbi:MAG: hypothetical protein H6737_08175 [Alphaproteobacteria bacterium]|nr:hypothetical protein [Alphaproteobacteria bacterium]
MRFLVALILSMLAANVARAGIVVWMDEEVPDEKVTTRADNKTGGTKHYAYYDLAYPPQPNGPADDEEWEALRQAVSDGKKRWDEFEVEYEIANDLEALITQLDVIRSKRDMDELVAALLFQGAAVQVAFEDQLGNDKLAAPFRYTRTGGVGNRPWSDAYALMPGRDPLASDVADGATYPNLLTEFEEVAKRPKGTLKLARVDEGVKMFVDGTEVEVDADGTALEVPPGRHFIHLVRDGVISGRQVVLVEEGRESEMMPRVSLEDLAAARARVDQETTTGFPESVKSSLEALSRHYGGQIFVASNIDGNTVVLPYAHGASLLKQRAVTFVGIGELGGGLMSTSLFDKARETGDQAVAPMGMGSLGFELGLYNFAIVGGTDLVMTPGNTITHAKGDSTTENVDTSVYVHPYAGAGVYLLRPTGRSTTALVEGFYSWHHPAHHAVGGRISLGLPFEPDGGTWIKLTIGGSGFPQSMWDEGSDRTSLVLLYARSGIAARF